MSVLSQDDYQFVSGFLHKEAGIALGGDKAYLVETRLGELCRSEGLKSISALVEELKTRPGKENRQKLVEAMTTNETSFFRDITPFDAIRSTLIPEFTELRKHNRTLRIWSAASSTGQEAYSLAMLLDAYFGRQRTEWKIEIVGTDIAEKVLNRARLGEYSQMEVNRGLPAQNLIQYFKKKGSAWHIGDNIRSMVTFQKVNLMNPPGSLGHFDIIFCCNVLIYFDLETKQKVLANLLRQLKPDGYLVLGASEVLFAVTDLFERVNRGGAVCYKPTSR